jgi:nucleoprotein TPR
VEDDIRQSVDKFSELQRTFESERLVWTNDKKTLEDTIVDLSTSEKTSETDHPLVRVKFVSRRKGHL